MASPFEITNSNDKSLYVDGSFFNGRLDVEIDCDTYMAPLVTLQRVEVEALRDHLTTVLGEN